MKDFHVPGVLRGVEPKSYLHLRMINGTVCLFDDQGGMIDGVSSIQVLQTVSDLTSVTVTLFVGSEPK